MNDCSIAYSAYAMFPAFKQKMSSGMLHVCALLQPAATEDNAAAVCENTVQCNSKLQLGEACDWPLLQQYLRIYIHVHVVDPVQVHTLFVNGKAPARSLVPR